MENVTPRQKTCLVTVMACNPRQITETCNSRNVTLGEGGLVISLFTFHSFSFTNANNVKLNLELDVNELSGHPTI